MFELRIAARWSGNGEAADGNLLERVGTEPLTLPLTPAASLMPAALHQTLPRVVGQQVFGSVATEHTSAEPATRALDLVVAFAALIFFAPLMVFIALTILITNPGPIFFRQTRLGLGGRTIGCLKFRTMRCDATEVFADLLLFDPLAKSEWESLHKLRRDPRVSRLGAFLRKTSLDELPQIFNVLAGDMSIVGPRPIVPDEAYRYRRYIRSYYAVKPGITGLWQISGRNHTTYRRRVACDVSYVRNRTVYRDIAIIVLTVPVVLLCRGAY